MRYTTIIDISQLPVVWNNKNTTYLYIYLALKCGYHDSDRDTIKISIRKLAAETGMTVSAVRNSLKTLQKVGLIRTADNTMSVLKWLMAEEPTPRPKTAKKARQEAAAKEREAANEKREQEAERSRQQREEMMAAGKTSWMLYYESRFVEAKAGDEAAKQWCRDNWKRYEQQREAVKKNQENP